MFGFQGRSTGAAALAIVVALTASASAQDGGEEPPIRRPVLLTTLDAAAGGFTREFFGVVRARRTVDVAFQVGGRIERLDVLEGAPVSAGAQLAALDLDAYARAVARAELALEQAERDLARAAQLAERNVGSEVELLNAQTARDLAEIDLSEARERLDDATLEAPFDAIVAAVLVDAFTTVAAGTPVLRLHDMSEVRIEIEVPERLVLEGRDPDDLAFEAIFSPGAAPVELTFREFRAETGAVGQSYEVSLAIGEDAAPEGLLLPGVTAAVRVTVADEMAGGLFAPATAVVIGADGAARVFVFEPSDADPEIGVVRETMVEIASPDGVRLLIVSGVAPGTQIVAVGGHLLSDGAPVRVFRGFGEDD